MLLMLINVRLNVRQSVWKDWVHGKEYHLKQIHVTNICQLRGLS
jgi:hypothetical protein